MKHKLSTTLALVVLTVAIAVATARAQTVANGPYYAPPAWDQTLPSATRFIVLSNMGSAAVLDRETGWCGRGRQARALQLGLMLKSHAT